MIVSLEMIDDLLPVCGEDISVIALETLVYLCSQLETNLYMNNNMAYIGPGASVELWHWRITLS